jgi:hypothetical protein
MARSNKPILRVILKGPGVRSGRIAVPDLIRLCEEAQNAVIRQAEAIEGRKTVHPGPPTNFVRTGCTLELIGIKRGSTTLEFGLADPQLKIAEMSTLGEDAITELTKTIRNLGNGASAAKNKTGAGEIAEGVLHGIIGLGRAVAQMKGITELRLVSPRAPQKPVINAPVNEAVTKAVAKRLSRPRRARVIIDGYLEMADFKPRDQKCRIEPAMGPAINCTFTADQEEQVAALTRHPVRITGEGLFPPNSEKIEVISIEKIEPLPSLAVGEGQFFSDLTLGDLAKMQDVSAIQDPSKLAGGFPSDEDIDAFLKDIYENRK